MTCPKHRQPLHTVYKVMVTQKIYILARKKSGQSVEVVFCYELLTVVQVSDTSRRTRKNTQNYGHIGPKQAR